VVQFENRRPSAAKAAMKNKMLTARLKPRPFKTKTLTARLKPRPFKTKTLTALIGLLKKLFPSENHALSG
jgi:hypothetical protein